MLSIKAIGIQEYSTPCAFSQHNFAIFKPQVQGNQYLRYYTLCACILHGPWHPTCTYNTIRIHDTTRIVLTHCYSVFLFMVGLPPPYMLLWLRNLPLFRHGTKTLGFAQGFHTLVLYPYSP